MRLITHKIRNLADRKRGGFHKEFSSADTVVCKGGVKGAAGVQNHQTLRLLYRNMQLLRQVCKVYRLVVIKT